MARTLTLIALIAVALGLASTGRSQDQALDDLLKKLEGGQPADAPAPASEDPKPSSDAPPADRGPSGEVAPKDQALDNLLEKLGETREEPSPSGQPTGPGDGPMPPIPPGPDQPKPGDLNGKMKDLDEHLEELTGRKRKKPQDQGGGEGSGPLSDLVKEMREVEQRLGQPDTGEETRQKQKQIVKNLETLIEQMKNSSGQGSGKKRMTSSKPGQGKPGGQDQPGAQANKGEGVGAQSPSKPKGQSILAGDKDAWGHLPAELRGEMANVFREEALPNRADLIRRYYLSVSKKSQIRRD